MVRDSIVWLWLDIGNGRPEWVAVGRIVGGLR